MAAGQDLINGANGVNPTNGVGLDWRWVRVRARTVFGNLSKYTPFNYPNPTYAATTSEYDAVTGASEQVSWRYVASDGQCYCFKDMVIVWWEHFLATTQPSDVVAAIAKASTLRPWPKDFPGTPPYERGQ